jgi:hypothetical protein
MKALCWGCLVLSTVWSFGVGRGTGLDAVGSGCDTLLGPETSGPHHREVVMAGWFLGVCHVDSGREHQPASLDLTDCWWGPIGVGLCKL